MKFYEHDRHFKLYQSIRADLNVKAKNRVFNALFCASSIGWPRGKKTLIAYSLCVEHNFK